MVNQTKRKQEKKQPKFKVVDMVAVKIDKVDKTSPLHPNMLLGKITSIEESGFVQIVTQYAWENKHSDFSFTIISLFSHYCAIELLIQLKYLSQQPVKKQVGFHRNSTPNNFNVYSLQKNNRS